MDKKRVILSPKSVTPELLVLLEQQYPYGFENKTITIPSKNGLTKAIIIETNDITYLVKLSSDGNYSDSEILLEKLSENHSVAGEEEYSEE